MRVKIFLGITVALLLLLQGCGRKGPLKLPAPQAQASAVPSPLQNPSSSKTP